MSNAGALLLASIALATPTTLEPTTLEPTTLEPTTNMAMTADDVVAEAARNNPGLRAALIDVQRAAEQVRAERWRYLPVFLADVDATTTTTPGLDFAGGTTKATRQALTIGADLRESLPLGTTIDLRVAGDASESGSPQTFVLGQPSEVLTLGPGYGLLARLTVAQPLLRGFGVDVAEAALRQAVQGAAAADRARDVAASAVVRDVLVAHWELWFADVDLDLENKGLALADEEVRDVERRVALGARAPVDLLTFQTRQAELSQAVLAARGALDQRALVVAALLGRSADDATTLRASPNPPAAPASVEASAALSKARSTSLAIAQARVAVSQARDLVVVADEDARPRLDVQAWVQTRGLGNQELAPVATQLSTFDNLSADVSLVFELPLVSVRGEAERRGAAFAVAAAEARLRAVTVQTEAAVAAEVTTLRLALGRRSLDDTTIDLASRSVDAERRRYEEGDGLALEVRQAEDTLRRARLAAVRARVDAVIAGIRLDDLTGDLLLRLPAPQP